MKVVTMAINAAASAFSNCAPQKATSPDLMGNTRPRRKPRDYASGGENRWGRRVPHRATASHAAALALLLLAGCDGRDARNTYADPPATEAGPSRAERAAQQFGLRNVRHVGMAGAWACSKDDSWLNSATVEGDTMAGGHVRATVCCGWLKGCTVRF